MVDAAMEGASVGWQCTSTRCARTSDAGNVCGILFVLFFRRYCGGGGEQLVTVLYCNLSRYSTVQ